MQGRVAFCQKSSTIRLYGNALARPYTTLHPTRLDSIFEGLFSSCPIAVRKVGREYVGSIAIGGHFDGHTRNIGLGAPYGCARGCGVPPDGSEDALRPRLAAPHTLSEGRSEAALLAIGAFGVDAARAGSPREIWGKFDSETIISRRLVRRSPACFRGRLTGRQWCITGRHTSDGL